MDIPELNSKARYDIRLLNVNKDETLTDVTWTQGVDYRRLLDAVLELIVMKERNAEAFAGDIIISAAGSRDPMPRYRRLQESSSDSSSPVLRSVPSIGEDATEQRPGHDHYWGQKQTIEAERLRRTQAELENVNWQCDNCSHIAGRHSNVAPFRCIVDGCDCFTWSGE